MTKNIIRKVWYSYDQTIDLTVSKLKNFICENKN